MTCDTLNELIVPLETSGYEMFWKYVHFHNSIWKGSVQGFLV